MSEIRVDYWSDIKQDRDMRKFSDRRDTYFFYFMKPEHQLVRDKRRKLRGNLYYCEYGQCSEIRTGLYNPDTHTIYKIDFRTRENTWIRPKFATMIRYHNLMSI